MATIKTTGILLRDQNTNFLRVELLNLDSDDKRKFTVQFFNWNLSGSPVLIGTPTTITLNPTSRAEIRSLNISNVVFVEARITISNKEDAVVNVFGAVSDAGSTTLIAANTVLQDELRTVDID